MTKKSKRILWILGVAALLIAIYNILLSAPVVKSLWLPVAGKMTGYDIEAEKVSVSLLMTPSVEAKELKISGGDYCSRELLVGKLRMNIRFLPLLFSRHVDIPELEIVRLKLKSDGRREAPEYRKQGGAGAARVRKKRKHPYSYSVKKISIYDADVAAVCGRTRYELSGIAFSASNIVQGMSPSFKFSAAASVNSDELKFSGAHVEGSLDMRLPSGSILPESVRLAFDTECTEVVVKQRAVNLALNATLNLERKGSEVSVSDSHFRVFEANSVPVLNAQAEGVFRLDDVSGKLDIQLRSVRSELSDKILSALVEDPVRGVEATASLDVDSAPGFKSVDVAGKVAMTADQFAGESRKFNSEFSFKGAKSGDEFAVSTLKLSLQEPASSLNLELSAPKQVVILSTPTGYLPKAGQVSVQMKKVNLSTVAKLLGVTEKLPMKSGMMTGSVNLDFLNSGMTSASGTVDLEQLTLSGERKSEPLDLRSNFRLTHEHGSKNTLSGTLSGKIGNAEVLSLEGSSEFYEKFAKVSVSKFRIAHPFEKALPYKMVDSLGIRSFVLNGSWKWNRRVEHLLFASVPPEDAERMKRGALRKFIDEFKLYRNSEETFADEFSGSFALTDFTTEKLRNPLAVQLSAEYQDNVEKTKNFRMNALSRDVWKFQLNVTENKNPVLDLNAVDSSGTLMVSSSFADAEKLQTIWQSFQPSKPAKAEQKTADKKPVPAGTAKSVDFVEPVKSVLTCLPFGNLQLKLAKIHCADDLNLSVEGPLSVNRRTLQIENMKISANDSPVALRLMLAERDGDWYYEGSLLGERLALAPLFRLFDGNTAGVSGTLEALNLAFSGKGLTETELKRNLNGTLRTSVRNLSFPARNERTESFLNLLTIPLKAVPQVEERISPETLPADFQALRSELLAVAEGKKNLRFDSGVLDAAVSNGVLTLNKFEFEGGTLKRESVTGSVELLSGRLNLDAMLELAHTTIPLSVRGKLGKPQLDITKSLVKFATSKLNLPVEADEVEKTVEEVKDLFRQFRKKRKRK